MDADGSHPAIFLPLLLTLSTRADLVVGSGYLNGVSVLNWNLRRVLLCLRSSLHVLPLALHRDRPHASRL